MVTAVGTPTVPVLHGIAPGLYRQRHRARAVAVNHDRKPPTVGRRHPCPEFRQVELGRGLTPEAGEAVQS
jgi:hypothetical protein